MTSECFEVADSFGLTDADWAEINRLRQLHGTEAQKALLKELAKLADDDPVGYAHIMGAISPDTVTVARQ